MIKDMLSRHKNIAKKICTKKIEVYKDKNMTPFINTVENPVESVDRIQKGVLRHDNFGVTKQNCIHLMENMDFKQNFVNKEKQEKSKKMEQKIGKGLLENISDEVEFNCRRYKGIN